MSYTRLLPFINATDTTISVSTQNPSNDDNIFFAYFRLSGAAVVGEGILLRPVSATNQVGTSHTVTARVVDDEGNPVPERLVTFEVISGPNADDTGTDTTNANGEATFTYTGDGGEGIDEIRASFVNPTAEETIFSNTVTKEWVAAGAIAIGDVNGDGDVDAEDARLILEVLVGVLSLEEAPHFGATADVNADHIINNLDAAIIAGISAEQIPPLPDSTRTNVTDRGTGSVTVTGSAGAVPSESTVHLTNVTSGASPIVAAANPDGSFSVILTATVGDKIVISVDGGPAQIALVVGDTDGDGLSDADEATHGTEPDDPDTDGDGFPDGFEVAAGSNPLDSESALLTLPLFLSK